MKTPHIHADALRALAEGKKLQWQYVGSDASWCDLHDRSFLRLLVEGDTSLTFREKPTTRQYRVALYAHPVSGVTTATVDNGDEAFDCEEDRYFSHWLTDWIEYEVPL